MLLFLNCAFLSMLLTLKADRQEWSSRLGRWTVQVLHLIQMLRVGLEKGRATLQEDFKLSKTPKKIIEMEVKFS